MQSTTSVWDMTLSDFRDAIESRPTPGCGAAAAASAGIGLALVLKGLRITDSKSPGRERTRLIAQAHALLSQLGERADDDVQAFNAYLDARKQPHESESEAERRAQAIEAAAERANRVPLDIARGCLEALELSLTAVSLTADNLQSDARAGVRLLHAGLSAVLLNVDANLASLPDARERDEMARARRQLQEEADRRMAALTGDGAE